MIGFLASLISGLFGIGGGIIFVPTLTAVFYMLDFSPAHIMHLSIGTSLAAMVLTTGFASLTHFKLGSIDKSLVLKIIPGMIIGVIAGGHFAEQLTTDVLRGSFALFLVLISLNYLLGTSNNLIKRPLPNTKIVFIFTRSSNAFLKMLYK